jgi:hypothetical protein
MPQTLDPLVFARFMVMPGASELVEAFSQIPPGPLRDSVISHAQVMALTYSSAPADQQMPDPLIVASGGNVRVPAPPALTGPTYTPKNQDEAIMARLMAGGQPADIGRELGVPRQKISAMRADAVRHGVKLGKLKPTDGKFTFATTEAELSGQGMSAMRVAARKRGLTVKQWLQARRDFVRLRMAKTPMDEIAVKLGLDEQILMGWLYSARRAGIDLPLYMDFIEAEIDAPAAPTPKPESTPRKSGWKTRLAKRSEEVTAYVYPVFRPLDQLGSNNRNAMDRWAAARGWTAPEMFEKREEIIRRRLDGQNPQAIAFDMQVDMDFVKNTTNNAAEKGVVFPVLVPLRRSEFREVPKNMSKAIKTKTPALAAVG